MYFRLSSEFRQVTAKNMFIGHYRLIAYLANLVYYVQKTSVNYFVMVTYGV